MITSILDLLEGTVERFPDKIAFSDDKHAVSFSNLQEQARNIGSKLVTDLGEGFSRPIIVLVNRSVLPLANFFGVSYSGNFYVPIEENTPEDRFQSILEVLDPLAIICLREFDRERAISLGYKGKVFLFSELIEIPANLELLGNVRKKIIDIDPVYAIFTSGSTGIPKAVVISHKSVMDLANWLVDTFNFSDEDILGNQTPFYFDASVKDIFIVIKTGASMHVLSHKYFSFPKHLVKILNEKKVTRLLWATSAVNMVANSGILREQSFTYLKSVFFAGEAMPAKQLKMWQRALPDCTFINLYGPTEVTVDSTYFIVDREFADDEFIPIGKACENKQYLILNDDDLEVLPGEHGELCIRGTGLALGYYNNPVKTREAFVQNPRQQSYPEKIYRTGDIVKLNEAGELLFIGRKDHQIKLMGNRIELGDIEAAFNAIAEITNVACVFDKKREKIQLFYTTSDGQEDNNIYEKILKKLPKYMIPGVIIHVKAMPINPNGKIDRIALSAYFE